ncbi:GAF domain-containing protein [Aliikangiella sp. IMCC44653]
MKEPQLPICEPLRLSTLHSLKILDTMPEEKFDRITRMAQRIYDVPFALISLVDEERQWFKSNVGLGATETPRSVSFCGHAILDKEVFVVEDTLTNPDFADNPLVTDEPKIRFYAGCPLHTLNGARIGTLCIIDTKPRELSGGDIATLKDLAQTVERELALNHLSLLDDITGITNRRGFISLGAKAKDHCKKLNLEAALSVLTLAPHDNDTAISTIREREIAAKKLTVILKENTDESEFTARIGDNQFAILFMESQSNRVKKVLAAIRAEIHRLNYETEHSCRFQVATTENISQSPLSFEELVILTEEKIAEKSA